MSDANAATASPPGSKFDQLCERIRQEGGTIRFTDESQFTEARKLLEAEGGTYENLPGEGSVLHQVNLRNGGTEVLTVEYRQPQQQGDGAQAAQ